jgi:Sec20
MMAQELELSQGNLSLVSSSTDKLSVASQEYTRQHGKLNTSKGLLRQIRWHERKEDILLYTGLAFFIACVLFVVLRRTLLFVPALPFRWLGRLASYVWSGAAYAGSGLVALARSSKAGLAPSSSDLHRDVAADTQGSADLSMHGLQARHADVGEHIRARSDGEL